MAPKVCSLTRTSFQEFSEYSRVDEEIGRSTVSIPLYLALTDLPPRMTTTNSQTRSLEFSKVSEFSRVEIGRSSVSIPLYVALTDCPLVCPLLLQLLLATIWH